MSEQSSISSGLLFGSMAADALALGAHWIYDQDELRKSFGRVTDFVAPKSDSYHPHKSTGDQSHYGDQALVLLDSLGERGEWDFANFAGHWRRMWEGYSDYFDHATKETLANFENGHPPHRAGSESEELGGAARLAPLLVATGHESVETAVAAARQQTSLTHRSAIALDAAEYVTRVTRAVMAGGPIAEAVKDASRADYATLNPRHLLDQVDAVGGMEPCAAVEKLGQACPAAQALPATVWLLLRYSDDLEMACMENVMAGGDSAARGLVLGMILGATGQEIPDRWTSRLRCAPQLTRFLNRLRK